MIREPRLQRARTEAQDGTEHGEPDLPNQRTTAVGTTGSTTRRTARGARLPEALRCFQRWLQLSLFMRKREDAGRFRRRAEGQGPGAQADGFSPRNQAATSCLRPVAAAGLPHHARRGAPGISNSGNECLGAPTPIIASTPRGLDHDHGVPEDTSVPIIETRPASCEKSHSGCFRIAARVTPMGIM